MQITTYFYHSNTAPYCITFLNDLKGLIKVIIAEFDGEAYWIPQSDTKLESFVVTYEELIGSANLYKTYTVSLIATANPYQLAYHTANKNYDWTSSIMDCEFCVETRKLNTGLNFDDHFSQTYGFDVYPLSITIDDEEKNTELKNHYLEIFNNDDEWLVSCNKKCVDEFLSNHIGKYIDVVTDYIEYTINNLEKDVAFIKRYNMFVDKVCKHKNIMKDIQNCLLRYICVSTMNDPIEI
jgi:hypothetical protein